jgi:hypothetical protein
MENIKQKIAEVITHTHKTPIEQADEILLLFSVSGKSEQLLCGDLIKHNFSLSKIGICYECKFIKGRAK